MTGTRNRKSQARRTGALASYRDMALPMRVLRLMLGGTFLYAGIYKALDGTFLDPASHGYIGAQLRGMVQTSPIAFLLNHMIEHATLIGWATMLGELAIGLAVLIGVWMLPAAFFGAVLSLTLWLSSSWAVHPYFLASDPAYLAMWIAFGAGLWPKGGIAREVASLAERRRVLQAAAVGAASIAAAAMLRPFASGGTTAKSPTSGSGGTKAKAGTKVATLSSLAVGQSVTFNAADGNPAVLIRTATNTVCAYSTVCTHQGCIVEYDPAQKELVCPCHGATYDPTHHAQVTGGPAPAPLQEYKATISGNDIIVT